MFRAAPVFLVLALAASIAGCSSRTESGMETSADQAQRQGAANDSLPTAMDQNENEVDRTITQSIRQAVVASDALGLDAKNAQIITANGVVTLRGSVKSDAEKTLIMQFAEQTPGVTRVDNLIEVAMNTGS